MITVPPDSLAASNDPLLAPLNEQQREAVLATEGPVLVLAGAGSGKTRVITHRIAWLVARMGVPGWQILAMTFTNKSAGEMRERARHMMSGLGEGMERSAGELWLGTFHSIGMRLMRTLAPYCGLQTSFSIYDTDDQLKMITRAMKATGVSTETHKPKSFANYIDRAKNRCLLPADERLTAAVDSAFDRLALKVYEVYEAEMRLANAVDFNDLIMRPVQVLAQHKEVCQQIAQRFRYVLVDEFQDTNHAQFELLKLLTSVHGNLTVVGDDDQSIYSWRGAEVGNILGFPDLFHDAKVIKLERNYRSTSNILKASTAVVSANKSRHGKVLWTEAGEGEKIRLHAALSDRDEADWVARQIERLQAQTPLGQFAVFYRTNSLSRLLEESMRRFRLPYVLIGGQRFYERAEVKDAVAWCRLLVNPEDSAGWLRAIVSPKRGIGQVTLDAVASYAESHHLSQPAAAVAMVQTRQGGKAQEKLAAFQALVDKMRDGIGTLRADKAGAMVLEQTGLRAALQSDGSPEAKDRIENLNEFLAAMADYADTAEDPSLRGFLDQVALVSDTDKVGEGSERVSLMTVHAAKGLEYDVSFVVGLEEGLLPHANAIGDAWGGGREGGREVEEERRLFYVAMTRARKRLHLSYARSRRRFGGQEMPSEPSRFLQQVPRELVEIDSGTPSWQRPLTGAWSQGSASVAGRSSTTSSSAWQTGPARTGAWAAGRSAVVEDESVHAPADEGPVIDRSERGGFVAGNRVRHVHFGIGQILEVDGYGSEARLTVQFSKVGMKKLIARFVQAV